jgi:hypothetical protein
VVRLPSKTLRECGHSGSAVRCQSGCEQAQQTARLFDHSIGAGEQHRRRIDAKQLRCLEIQDGLKLRGLDDWQIAGFFAR